MRMENEHLPFAGDTFIGPEIARLVERFQIRSIIETGTYQGVTTQLLVTLAAVGTIVHTIELNPKLHQGAYANLIKLIEAGRVVSYLGDSSEVLDRILPNLLRVLPFLARPCLFFLDAHWGGSFPILRELKMIACHGCDDACIVIHDFKVPDKPWKFDSLEGQALDWEYVQSSIEAIYGPEGFDYYYNLNADGAKRGVLYVTPKREPE